MPKLTPGLWFWLFEGYASILHLDAPRRLPLPRAAHDRVGEAEFTVAVGANEHDVVADVDDERRRDIRPRAGWWRADPQQKRQGDQGSENVNQRGVDRLVVAGLDQCVPRRMQHRAAQHEIGRAHV